MSCPVPPQTAEYLLEKGLLDLVVPRSFLKGALYEIIDFYKDAPYKRRGSIPFGVQRGSYGLTAEEKMRRRWREWSNNTLANGDGTPALMAADNSPSFQVMTQARTLLESGQQQGDCCTVLLSTNWSVVDTSVSASSISQGSSAASIVP